MEYITKEKQKELELELADLKTNKRKEIADALEFAKSLGDLSENAEYSQAREAQGHLEDRIGRIEYILRNAKIVGVHHSNVVEVGSVVTVVRTVDKKEFTFTVVGAEEADVKENKISFHSPLGKALLGHAAGDSITADAPKGPIGYTIKNIA